MGPPVHSALITRARRIAATASAKCSTHSLRAEHITQAKLGGASDHVIADQTRVDHFTKALRAEDHAERSTTPLLAFDPVGRLDRGIVLAVHADRTDTANDAVRQVCGLVSTRLSIAEKARGFMDGHGGEHGADIVYENGRFFTVDDARPWATAVAVRDGRLVAVGTRDEMDSWIAADTNVVDSRGCFVMPGIHDAHVHPGRRVQARRKPATCCSPRSSIKTVSPIRSVRSPLPIPIANGFEQRNTGWEPFLTENSPRCSSTQLFRTGRRSYTTKDSMAPA